MQKLIIVLISLAILASITLGGLWLLQNNRKTQQNEKQAQINSDVAIKIPIDWQTYNNEVYNFQLSFPLTWNMASGNLDKFAPIFNVQEQTLSFGIDIFDNKTKLTTDQWIEKNNFFYLKQYKNPDTYVVHGISEQATVITEDNLQVPVYFCTASGGGSTGTAIIAHEEKMIVFAYSLPSYEERETTKELFKNIVKTFKFKIKKEK